LQNQPNWITFVAKQGNPQFAIQILQSNSFI